jgi:hypothetical protein
MALSDESHFDSRPSLSPLKLHFWARPRNSEITMELCKRPGIHGLRGKCIGILGCRSSGRVSLELVPWLVRRA